MLEKCIISGFADEISPALADQIAVLKELGQHYIELRSIDGINISAMTMEQAAAYKKVLDENDIHVSALGSPIGKIGIHDDFEAHFELFRHVVELAKFFETPYIRMFSFYMPENEDPAAYRTEVLDRLKKLAAYAEENQIILLHENEKGIYGDIASRCADLMKELYGPAFKCTFDFANFVQCGQDTLEAYELLKPYITYMHIKDARFSDGVVVLAGTGDGMLPAILEKLHENGYEGYLSLEPHLTDFLGLQGLEKDAKKRGESDGAYAFKSSYYALKGLIK